MTTNNKTKGAVTVVGLGAMGTALANAFLNANYTTTVWNRSPEKVSDMVVSGAKGSTTITEAVLASPLIVVCVLNYEVVYRIFDELDWSVLADRIVVNLTNGTPKQAREMAIFIEGKGAKGYVDGGIMAVPSLIGQKEAFLLYSGSKIGFEAYQSVLSALGAVKFLGTDAGIAALHDLALLSGMYGMFGGFLQATALIDSAQVPITEFTTSLLIPWLQAMTTAMPEMAAQIEVGNYVSKEANLAMQVAGGSLVDFSIAQGVKPDLLVAVELLMKQRVADGHGGDDFASLFELIRKKAASKTEVIP
ncbi:NAD(P)-dependent oxidoreductase [Sphingobacterium sp. SGR-19]|uniref:NAD(P)-dependent oxidoreductase n=1 Tax=Sphingobacterium sp. SGR-19 TaxID=2710886 RepID=UPI0013EB3074|nr:NAD(P)-binding domain-containing protein [Sphingobacterium sp. SGR-19]NGM64207.1 NAD(P)-dependent oxidoreductase [Sphingobacterium sp. SGR-19]